MNKFVILTAFATTLTLISSITLVEALHLNDIAVPPSAHLIGSKTGGHSGWPQSKTRDHRTCCLQGTCKCVGTPTK